MVHSRLGWLTIACLSSILLDRASATSHRPTPLGDRAVVHPRHLQVSILPRHDRDTAQLVYRRDNVGSTGSALFTDDERLAQDARPRSRTSPEWNDRWLVSFVAHDDVEVTLSLKPASTLLHPQGVKLIETVTTDDGERHSTERTLARNHVKVYEGVALGSKLSQHTQEYIKGELAGLERDTSMHPDWARITVLSSAQDEAIGSTSENAHLPLSGAFSLKGEIYSVETTTRYMSVREALDPEPPSLTKRGLHDTNEHTHLVVIKERDLLTPEQHLAELVKRGLPTSALPPPSGQCGHDDLPFNVDLAHPVMQAGAAHLMGNESPFESSFFGLPVRGGGSGDDFDYFARPLVKRQSDGDIITGGDVNASSNFINNIGNTAGCPKSPQIVFVGVAADCTYTSNYGGQTAAREQILSNFNQANALYQRSFNMSLGIVELNVQSGSCPTSASQVDPANPWNVGCQEGGSPGVSLNDRLSIFSQWRGDKGGADGAGLWHLMTNCSTGTEIGVAWLGQVCRVTASYSQGQTSSGTGVTSITRNEWQVVAHEIGHNFGCFASPGQANNPPIISIESCGNGIVENDEQCDPGSQDDPCCDRETCRFINGATCSPLNSLCCTSQCQLASQGTVCRPSIDATCDREEVCSGSSAECPEDRFEDDDGGRCQNAECQSGSALDTAKSWYTNNLRISIPVTVVVGIIVLLLLAAIIRCIFCRNRPLRKNKAPKHKGASSSFYAPPPGPPHGGYAQNGFAPQHQYPPGPPPVHPQGRGSVLRRNDGYVGNGNNWVDPAVYNGPNYR
ncbi:hypothetical protein OIO90_006022 [Microbotryomycetes sp. JL221]|nr:hypothetical protein OIO90_006022 [Microbotryomycetes sp. JL221]